jgi:arabinofuranosyltransferase
MPNQKLMKDVALAGALFVISLVFAKAWVHEDAFITFRVVENLVSGFGPVFNVGERVQVFTHPLWFFALVPWRILGIPPFYGSIFLGLICTAFALWFAWKSMAAHQFHPLFYLLFCLILTTSGNFLDFSTSGLENSMTHMLLAGFVYTLSRRDTFSTRGFTLAVLTAALLVLNRLDTVLMVLPAILYLSVVGTRTIGVRKLILVVLMASIPLWLWEVFSTVYYGSPLPNTYFAKLGGYTLTQGLRQGITYLADFASTEPIAFGACVLAAMFLLRYGDAVARLLGLGALLSICYVVSIGGDYMTGRFFTPAFFLFMLAGLNCCAHQVGHARSWMVSRVLGSGCIALFFVTIFTLNTPPSEIWGKVRIWKGRTPFEKDLSLAKVYYQGIDADWAREGRTYAFGVSRGGKYCYNRGAVGMTGYYAGPAVALINGMGLVDPFVARLPALQNVRPGHVFRDIPSAYISLREMEYKDPETAKKFLDQLSPAHRALWEHVYLLSRAPLFSYRRAKAIFKDFFSSSDFTRAIIEENLQPVEVRAIDIPHNVEEVNVYADGIRIKGWAGEPDTPITVVWGQWRVPPSVLVDQRSGSKDTFGLSSRERRARADIRGKMKSAGSENLGFDFLISRPNWMPITESDLYLGFDRGDHVDVFWSAQKVVLPPTVF